ncbi:WbqC family protein [Algoriphagus sp. CAU 1675]|uniref:WbqC family protein n=1 Tax=Algoriphagus sp. CAU 1675 TaxID=3032597 RepID=UPI0023DB631F|nr:WbqC family protein [Algoriphagus sp. CAU 1675]MDF2157399.1 WbqC family protein [Algoriphagus sp. CAU 1675]
MNRVVADLHYLPSLEYFCSIMEADELILVPQDQYKRQSYFNRTRILLANKVETLSVPIVGRRPRLPQGEIKIDFSQKWQAVHQRGIQSAYGKAPFYEFYAPYFEGIFDRKPERLWDLNLEMLTICLKLLQLPVKIRQCEKIEELEGEKDIRGLIEPKSPFSERQFYSPEPYHQLFGSDFEPNLSILDLMFCEGPGAKKILYKSVKKG